MTMWLKQSTSVVVQFGPFLDKTDGVTLETGIAAATLDHATTGIMISKNGGTLAVRNGTPTASAYDAHGMYKITLNTTDTGTLGTLRMVFTDAATHLPVWQDFMVVTANVWDTLCSTDTLQADVTQVNGAAQTATLDTIKTDLTTLIGALAPITGTIGSTGNDTTHLHLTGLPYGNDELNNLLIKFTDVSLTEVHFRWITDYDNAAALATLHEALPVTPQNATDTYVVYPIRGDSPSALDVSALVDLIWDEVASGHSTAGSTGKLISDYLNASIAAIPTTPMRGTDSAALASVCTEARLAKLASLTFSTANQVDANTLAINSATVVGDGNATPWDGA